MSQIYISRDQETFGPYTDEEARQYLGSGQLAMEDAAIFAGGKEWKPLGDLLVSATRPMPPPPRPFFAQVVSQNAPVPVAATVQARAEESGWSRGILSVFRMVMLFIVIFAGITGHWITAGICLLLAIVVKKVV